MDAFLADFQVRIRDSKSRSDMLDLFEQMLPAHRDKLDLSESAISRVISEFQTASHSTKSRAALVEMARAILTRILSSPPIDEGRRHDSDDSDGDSIYEGEKEDMKEDVDLLITQRFEELRKLSPAAREQLDELVIEIVDRYRL
jgi:hypothetical protein